MFELPEDRGTPPWRRGCQPLVGRHGGLDVVDLTHEGYHWTVWVPSGHRLSARRVQTFCSTQRVPLLAPTSPRAVDLASPTLAVVLLSRTVLFGALLSPIHLSWLHVASTWSFWLTISFAAPNASHGKAWQASPATTLCMCAGSRMRAVTLHTVLTPTTHVVCCMCMLYGVHAYGRLTRKCVHISLNRGKDSRLHGGARTRELRPR